MFPCRTADDFFLFVFSFDRYFGFVFFGDIWVLRDPTSPENPPPRKARGRGTPRGRAGHTIILYDFFSPFFFVKFVFVQQFYCFRYTGAAKTRLTENGVSPEPNLLGLRSLSRKKAYINPNLCLTASRPRKVRLIVFASRKVVPVFWSLRSP